MNTFSQLQKNHRKSFLIFLSTYLIAFLISREHVIAISISSVATSLAYFASKHLEDKRSWQLLEVVPEIIDHIISGVQSGLSLNQSLINLGTRGPKISQNIFRRYRENTFAGIGFEESIEQLQNEFALSASDQLFESLVFAKNLGGSELLALLRQLGDFTRQDLSLRREISAKQGWIKNSAHLSAGAPWLLLLLLSAQPTTAAAFTTPSGALVLGIGIVLTLSAYLWMGRLSRLPQPARIFGAQYGG
jgi:tight adherence protein B